MSENSSDETKLCCVSDYEKRAAKLLTKSALDYYKSGACGELTLHLNKRSFERLRIRPRMLKDVSNRTMACKVLGTNISAPIGVSPTAMQRMAHPEGECANARAVGKFNSIFILSTLSTSSIEEVAEAAPDTIKWFQLYVYKERELTKDLVRRAMKAGFKAVVLTVDAPLFGKRYADIRNEFKLPSHLRLKNFSTRDSMIINSETCNNSSLSAYIAEVMDLSLTWDDVIWLKSFTQLPIIIKGVLTAEDAKICVDIGVEGIIVSNHGARQLDTVPASIEALPEIVEAVGDKLEVYLDGGVTYGTDVLKAIALGAKMVFVGRPALWGLACNGEEGVKHVLDLLAEEFSQALALTGCNSVDDVHRGLVVHESYYRKFYEIL